MNATVTPTLGAKRVASPHDDQRAEKAQRTAPRSTTPMGSCKIDPAGDVICEVGSGARQLLVSSKVLSLASEAFSAMFKPPFLEGQRLSTVDPPIIQFIDHKYGSFHRLMSLLHHKTIGVPDEHDCLRLVLLADKYGCTEAIAPHTASFIDQNACDDTKNEDWGENDEQYKGLVKSFVSAYVIREKQLVDKLSLRMATWIPIAKSYLGLVDNAWSHLVPSSLWTYLSEHRIAHRDYILDRMSKIFQCAWGKIYSTKDTVKALTPPQLRPLGGGVTYWSRDLGPEQVYDLIFSFQLKGKQSLHEFVKDRKRALKDSVTKKRAVPLDLAQCDATWAAIRDIQRSMTQPHGVCLTCMEQGYHNEELHDFCRSALHLYCVHDHVMIDSWDDDVTC